ncbi:hypothetical protein UFOVP1313_5 [uncultured Caudovirales phage]|uniref:Uncharacterized protein n=1 Tax=uncultured Caudovirales phage TaxID=2100421 RepID=A0A6J5RIV6_9CAUD|nr:hypothetical protein UFOVP1313_5 [uncultured Caudovirales phage]
MSADNIQYPYGPPTVSGDNYTVDFLTQDPSRVTRVIANLALQKFYVDAVFAPAGAITGGAVLYEQATENDLYAQRDVENVEAGSEFPIVTFDRNAPRTAQVEKFGGKFAVTDEARRRNQIGRVNRAIQQLANTIQRRTQAVAIAELEAAVTEHSRTAVGTPWDTNAGVAAADKVSTSGPLADLTAVEKSNANQELGYTYDFAIMNPNEWRYFRLAAGGQVSDARALLADSGINDVWVTNRKSIGSVYWLAQRQVGELGYEVPLSTETWRDSDGKQQDWYQSYVLPICYVTDPFAILETTGHFAD